MLLAHILYICVIIFNTFKFTQSLKAGWRARLRAKQTAWELGDHYEGDILLKTRNLQEDKYYWPTTEYPYEISDGFDEVQKGAIIKALDYLDNKTCIKPRPKRDDDLSGVFFSEKPGQHCFSYVGYVKNRQPQQEIRLDPNAGCLEQRTILHEILHSLGLWHQHTATDRDFYIKINWKNIQKGREYNFLKSESEEVSLGFDYDYDSVMHYSSYAFSANGRKTIESSQYNRGGKMGKSRHLSKIDIEKIKKIYNC